MFASFVGIDTVDRRNPIVSRLYHVDIDFWVFFCQADGAEHHLSCLIFRQHIPSTGEDNVKKMDLK